MVEVKTILFLFVIVLIVDRINCGMNMAQFQQMKGMLKSVCMPRSGVKAEALAKLKDGEFPDDDRKLKCFFSCVLTTGQVMKGGKLNVESLRRQAGLLPAEVKGTTLETVENCKNVEGADSCELSYAFIKCHYAISGRENFLFQ
uniref:Odorant binding protein 2 n=1 Tax=Subpsaltria yangi TaxID=1195109 RepID=A0A385IUP3_9HEMI|nr:odorant binding protein 2 [Subpsaltria yangi]